MDTQRFLESISDARQADARGRVRSVVGLSISADVPYARLGDLVSIARKGKPGLLAEIVGFRDHRAVLLPASDIIGIGPEDPIEVLGEPLTMRVSDALLGRVLDGLGHPLDGGPECAGDARALSAAPVQALSRPKPTQALPLGIRAIDAFCTLAEGQRIGLFAEAGLGKSTLLQQVARHSAADVIVLCLVGERGREVADFISALPQETRARSVLVCATSGEPALVRLKCAQTATTVAEHFADQGKRVLLLMDSLTRYARAARDVGLSAGEMPVRRGFPPSVFAALPTLLERAGMRPGGGSITALYSVLTEGDVAEDPIADELRGLLDGHILLRRDLAARGHYPAIDILHSLSRLMPSIASTEHLRLASQLRETLSVYEVSRDLLELGAVTPGKNPKLDDAVARMGSINAFLRQPVGEHAAFQTTVESIASLIGMRSSGL